MYIGAIPTPAATESRQEFTATANQTVFSTTGGTVGYCDCFLNGVKMANSDFSFDGADVTLTTGTAAGDVLAVVMRQADNALVALPIKDSAGNNVLSEANNQVTATNVAIDGSGYKPAEVWLSTTTINSSTTNIYLPAGYSSYSLRGTDLFFSESGNTTGRIALYFQYGSYTTDTAIASFTRYARIESANANDLRFTGYLVLADNMAGEPGDNCNFIGWIHDPTTPSRTRAYSCDFLTAYGHDAAAHSYSYKVAGRSETTNVITRIQIAMSTNSGSVVAPFGGKVVLTGLTG